MTTHKIYGFCQSCNSGIISVIKSDKVDNNKTLYLCQKCNTYSTFDFTKSDIIEERIKIKKSMSK